MHVAVVGGGIVGLACAYYLRERDARVTVLEQGSIGHGSTPRASGGIREQFSTPVSIMLSRESIRVWERFDQVCDVDIGYRQHGYLYVAREDDTAATIEAAVKRHNAHGVPSQFVPADELETYAPGLDAGRFVGGTYCPTDGSADPVRALQGFAFAADRAGASLRLGTPVTGIVSRAGRVVAVETQTGLVEADVVVNAAGAWAPTVGRMAGVELPITPVRRQLLLTQPRDPVPLDAPFLTDLDAGVYFRPYDAVHAHAGGHRDPHADQVDPDAYTRLFDDAWADETLSRLATVSSHFRPRPRIVDGWAGLYGLTPDHHPVIEEVRPGFVAAAGFSGHGFMQAPATGQVVADLVTDGASGLVDVSALSADRFDRDAALGEDFISV